MEKQLTTEQSLDIIARMIEQSRNNLRHGSSIGMIFAGWSVAALALINFALLYLLPGSPRVFHIWWLMLPLSLMGSVLQRRTDRSAIVRTQIDAFIGSVWDGFAIAVFTLLAVLFATALFSGQWRLMQLCTPIIMLMCGMGEYATAKICRFRPFLRGAVVFWLGALLCVPAALLEATHLQFIILAAGMIAGFILPGHALNRQATGHV